MLQNTHSYAPGHEKAWEGRGRRTDLDGTVNCAKKHERLRRRVYFFRRMSFSGSVVRRSEQGSEVDTFSI
nr:unnamed protein product [Haemonchus contortus]